MQTRHGVTILQGYKYPRRLRTGRPLAADDKRETNAPGDIWVPQDEDFDETKSVWTLSDVMMTLSFVPVKGCFMGN